MQESKVLIKISISTEFPKFSRNFKYFLKIPGFPWVSQKRLFFFQVFQVCLSLAPHATGERHDIDPALSILIDVYVHLEYHPKCLIVPSTFDLKNYLYCAQFHKSKPTRHVCHLIANQSNVINCVWGEFWNLTANLN